MSLDQDFLPLSHNLLKLLTEKIYEKRKTAALEVEKMMRDYVVTNNTVMVQKLLKVLAQDLTFSDNSNYRKGGLIGLAAASIALGKQTKPYLSQIITPVLSCFNDSDSRIRYFACEALYNVVKVAREETMIFFPEIFDVLSKGCSDSDTNVKNGSELLDRLVKDVVVECKTFDLEKMVPLLRERIYARNPYVRQFMVSWISVLDSVPEIPIQKYLPEILDGLFIILSDPRLEIRKACEAVLGEFLHGIVNVPQGVDYSAMINILIAHSQAPDELVQFTAILWIKQFVKLAGPQMLPYTSGILVAVLPCLSLESEGRKNIRENAKMINHDVLKNFPKESNAELPNEDILTLDLMSIVQVLVDNLTHQSVPTRLASVRWVSNLLEYIPRRTFKSMDKLFTELIKSLQDSSDEVVLAVLEVFAEITSVSDQQGLKYPIPNSRTSITYFRYFIQELLHLFKKDLQLLQDRGHFMVRQLCLLLRAEEIYTAIAEALVTDVDSKFASVMVQALNNILLTASEVFELRKKLQGLVRQETTRELFVKLYRCWAHNPIATVSLCLLSQQYQQASDLLEIVAGLDVTVDHLTEIDKLIQLIESPVFTSLRMQLLKPDENAHLVKTLYGLLMLLPQSEAFDTLRSRLDCVPRQNFGSEKPNSSLSIVSNGEVDGESSEELLEHFRNTQFSQQVAVRKQRQSNKLALPNE